MQYPNTYKRFVPDRGVKFPNVFEPSLRRFSPAFRHGEPTFDDPAKMIRWHTVRDKVMCQLFEEIEGSRWRNNLILRGSMLLRQWLGAAARAPSDIDWVVRPHTLRINDPMSWDLFSAMKKLGRSDNFTAKTGANIIDVRGDDIWVYDRVPGRRIVFYWRTADTLFGFAQMDFVFGEEMWTEPTPQAIKTSLGKRITLWTASREQSLAWKLMWLDTDMYPQGKDLYDAVLLAEHSCISPALLQRALSEQIKGLGDRQLPPDFPMSWEIDWENFQLEYPHVEGDEKRWQERLKDALQGTVQQLHALPNSKRP